MIWTIERNLKKFQPESPSNQNMGNKDKDKNKDHSDSSKGAMGGENTQSPRDAHHANRDLSWEREARDTALAK